MKLVFNGFDRTFASLPFWCSVEPFEGWNRLVELTDDIFPSLTESTQSYLAPPSPTVKTSRSPRSPMYGDIGKFPISAMLCTEHQLDECKTLLGSAHLQTLHARWREAKHLAEEHNAKTPGKKKDPLDLVKCPHGSSDRVIRLPHALARAMRDLSGARFRLLLECLQFD